MLELIDLRNKNKDFELDNLRDRELKVSKKVLDSVNHIIESVKDKKDTAIKEFTTRFDKVFIEKFEIPQETFKECLEEVEEDFLKALIEAKNNIYNYHKYQKSNGYFMTDKDGVFKGQRVIPLEKVGVYVPGGSASYPSSVLMNVVPAKIAGVSEIIMVTPPTKDGVLNKYVAAAAYIAGVDRVFTVGGAQAIAALAYGTETIPKVDKIVGPGNIYVATAKRLVYGIVDIDMIAGPSEILVIADENANPDYIAGDLLSQAEHDSLSSAILVTTSKKIYDKVCLSIQNQIINSPRKSIIEESLKNYGKAFLCNNLEECIKLSNRIAPEHLEIMTEKPMELLDEVKNAGSVFLGYYTPEAVGDYFGGTNHVLPTNGTSRFFSPLSVDSFIKKSSFLYYSKEALSLHGNKIIELAEKEGLDAHANSIRLRL
ncbi:histidinol dehydrogenase [Clostridium cavendishii DSM 21758]|uniref:Histidinol dehydrogenase n=1 Tax=Clostridium cavendishii DSM 21758 TaxID=1121302 RepID=A0A1M6F1G6_9CLOT|nr:histidinol dehydrogenase [Clostridium cavendishii]SHI91532.1 histidinol dehydrogenase [Clostridium cavendishii DSM 21758]